MGIIQNIRQKPVHTRLRIIWGIVITSFMLLVLVWVIIYATRNRNNNTILPETNKRIKDSQEHWQEVLPSPSKLPVK